MKITILAKAALIAVCGLSMQVALAESSATGTFDVISGSTRSRTNTEATFPRTVRPSGSKPVKLFRGIRAAMMLM